METSLFFRTLWREYLLEVQNCCSIRGSGAASLWIEPRITCRWFQAPGKEFLLIARVMCAVVVCSCSFWSRWRCCSCGFGEETIDLHCVSACRSLSSWGSHVGANSSAERRLRRRWRWRWPLWTPVPQTPFLPRLLQLFLPPVDGWCHCRGGHSDAQG